MARSFAKVSTALPGPKSRAIIAREQPYLAPGIQQISQLAGLALEGGQGAVVVDADGNRFLDFNAGIGVASIGHGHPALAKALHDQALKITSGSYASEARASLLERIASQTSQIGSGKLVRTMLYSGGAEAVESALR
ncbi:MAG: aminotransferase class III-fold pyridoxal phosphate-dependent enzyme, partial [Polyangia bacterium]